MRTIILEGPDGAGKSTLAAKLRQLGYAVVPFGVPPAAAQRHEESIFRFFFDPLYRRVQAGGRTVFDRLHLSDAIYGPLMRGGTLMTPRAEALIERYVEAADGQVVICLPPRWVAFANWLRRKGTEYVKEAKIFNQVYDGYVQLLFNHRRNRSFLWYDYTRRTASSFARALAVCEGQPTRGTVGSQQPRFLFVGERPGRSSPCQADLAFMTTRGSSGWLFDAVRDAGFQEREVAFTNALGTTGAPKPLDVYWQQFPEPPVVIALGKVAVEACAARFVPVFEILDHPQHAKRFNAKHRDDYVRQLAEARRRAR